MFYRVSDDELIFLSKTAHNLEQLDVLGSTISPDVVEL
jgi:hypothetical protein